MTIGCFTSIIDSNKFILVSISIILAITLLILLKRYNLSTKLKISLIYGHLTLLFFPFVLLTTNFACGTMCMSCYNNLTHLVVYALPSTLLFSSIAGFVVIPAFYVFSNKKREIRNKYLISFIRKYSKKININTPKLYAVDKAIPMAFSFRSLKSSIFLSVGLLDILNRREIESVLLHELAHIKHKSSAMKLSSLFMKVFSPFSILARFHHDTNEEEKRADDFVIKTQRTKKYLSSAKRKMDDFF